MYEPVGQSKEPRNKSAHQQSEDHPQKSQEHRMKKGLSLQQMMLEKLDIHMRKNEYLRLER